MKTTLTLDQYLAFERLRLSLGERDKIKAVEIEADDPEFGKRSADYVRVTFHADWGGKAVFDIDNEGNSAAVNSGESEISIASTT